MRKRDDIHGQNVAPESIAKYLLKQGGKNPHGEANYRVINTSSLYVKRGGVWNEWPAGMSVQERGGLMQTEGGLFTPSLYKPLRRVPEVREILKYNHIKDRWLVERWCPAHMYGSRAAWEKLTVPEHPDLPMLGPYPEFGDYEMASDPTPYVPSLSQLQEVIQVCEFLKNKHRETVEQACITAHNAAVKEYEREAAEYRENLRMMFMDAMIPTNRVSLAAGRHRNELAKRAGIREHCGN